MSSRYGRKPSLTLASLIVFALVALLPLGMWIGARVYKGIQYDIHVGGHLKRAADSNTVERAKTEVDTALKGIEDRGWTEGSTHVLWETPATDVGFWYDNLKEASEELASITEKSTPLERSNMLMKLRETILDEGESVSVTSPGGISIHPNNVGYFWILWLIITWEVVVCIYVVRTHDMK